MKIRGWVTTLGLFVFVLGITACGGGAGSAKYGDVKSMLNEFNDATENWIEAMDKADTAKKVADALSDYAKKMTALRADMTKMEEKYPELKDMADPPAELAEEAAKMEELMSKMMSIMMKVSQFADDPEVQKAQAAFEEAMK
jgi:methyl-accepting chemotaxis protein